MSRRVVVRASGGPEVLVLEEGPLPVPRRGQVRIRVRAAGVAFGDLMRRRGVLAPWRPFTPGYDVVGEVEAVGPGVAAAWEGERVACLLRPTGLGGYAEHALARVPDLVRVPEGLDEATAAALVLNYVTAWQIVHRVAGLRPGQRLLVHGASGGVGTALLDVGRHAGLTLYGTASARKHDLLRARGAEPIDYRSEDVVARVLALAGDGVDAVADPIGGENLAISRAVLRRGGTLVFFGITGEIERGLGALGAGMCRVATLALRPDGRRVRPYGITVPPGSSRGRCREDLERVLALAAEGVFTPAIGARLPLAEAAEAHRRLEAGEVVGKVVLHP